VLPRARSVARATLDAMLLSRPVAAGGAASRSGDLQAEPPSFLSVQLPAGHWIDEIDIEARLVADEGVPAGQAQTIVAKYAGRASEATGWQIAVRQEAFALVDRAILPADEVAPPTAPAVSTPPATAAATAPSLPAVAASFTRSQSQPQLSDAVAPVKPSKPAASAAPRRRNDLPKREAASGAQEKIATITQSQPAKTSASREAARSGAMNWKLTKKGDAAENEPRGKVYKISNSRTDVSSHVTQYRGQLHTRRSVLL
jgi:hypothetical protein